MIIKTEIIEDREILREQLFEIVNNQLQANDPPETRNTYDRLLLEGFNDLEARQLIGQCVIVELFDVMNSGKPFDQERYVKHLKALPKEPF